VRVQESWQAEGTGCLYLVAFARQAAAFDAKRRLRDAGHLSRRETFNDEQLDRTGMVP